jgi:hypothetical protein
MCSSDASAVSPEVVLAREVDVLVGSARRVAAMVGSGSLEEVTRAGLPDVVASLLQAQDLVAAVTTVATGALHLSGALDSRGRSSTTRWLQEHGGLSRTAAAASVGRGVALREQLPTTAFAWLAGQVSEGSVRELTSGIRGALRGLPASVREEQRADAEAILLHVARVGTVEDVRRAVDRLRLAVDPDGASEAAMAAYDDQSLSCTRVGSMSRLTWWTTHESAATAWTVLDQVVDGWFRDGSLHPADRPAPDTGADVADGVLGGVARVLRTARHRRAHLLALALGERLTGVLDTASVGSRHGVAPHVTLTVDLDTLLAGLGGDLLVPGVDDLVLLPAASVERVLCDADVTTVLTRRITCPESRGSASDDLASWLRDASHEVLHVGRAHRTVPPRLRRALEVRDRHCAFPGCRVDVSRTHAHHVDEWWRDDGPTDVDNLTLLCARHHHYVHEGGWRIVPTAGASPRAGGCWTFLSPSERPARP